MKEHAICFQCEGVPLLGIVHEPEISVNVGMIIVVAGGPQYRVGVNRQFVMLARMLADRGIPVLRFDHRGTGDSGGECGGFLNMSADIESAVSELKTRFPQLDKIALWGECESASAIAFYAHTDPRVCGLFLVNPWIRTEGGEARTYLKHYYLSRLFDKELWGKIASGKFSFVQSFKSFLQLIHMAKKDAGSAEIDKDSVDLAQLPLPVRLEKSVGLYDGEMFIITSGRDFIAQEFNDYVASSKEWKSLSESERMQICNMPDADHTFSRLEWREELFDHTREWIEKSFITSRIDQ